MSNRRFSAYDHIPIHWLPEFKQEYDLLLRAWQRGYQIDRWNSPESIRFKYGVYKKQPAREADVFGVFDSPEEVVGLLRFLLATAEKEG